ncbi:MAG: porin family protein [Rhodothermales bacterium]
MMKKSVLLISAGLLATVITTRAQALPEEERLRSIHFGLSGGLNYIDIRNPFDAPDPEIDHVFYSGLSVGFLAGYDFDDTFGIRAGLFYSRQGRKAEETIGFESGPLEVKKTVDLDYVQIPLLLHLKTNRSQTGFYGQFGLVYSMLLSADVVRNGVARSDTDQLFHDSEFGALLELGPSLSVSENVYLTLGFRGYFAITDLNHEDLDTTGLLVGKSQNVAGGLHLTLYYMLPLGQ